MTTEFENDGVPVILLRSETLHMRPEEIDTHIDGMMADATETPF